MPSFTSIIYIIIIIIFSFLFGVKYSEPVKMYSSWIFEDGNQAELPKLSEDMLKQEPQDFDYDEPESVVVEEEVPEVDVDLESQPIEEEVQ